MKKQKHTKEIIAANLAAIMKDNITPEDILQEFISILEDYFIGYFQIENKAINLNFLNGQNFRLTVEELQKKYKISGADDKSAPRSLFIIICLP